MNIIQLPRKYSSAVDIVKFVFLSGFLVWLLLRGGGKVGYNWQWYRVPDFLYTVDQGHFLPGPLLNGLAVTMEITACSLFLASFIGLLTALLRLSHSMVGRIIARVYLEVIRNSPLLVQIFFLYFVLAPIFELERFTAAVVALSLFEGAYASEIFRSGITAVRRGQWEAAYSLGLSSFDTYRKIILPQALKKIVPPLTGQAISLIKDSALVSTIAVYDLTMEGRAIIAETFLTFEVWFTVAAIYLAITLGLSLVVNRLERRYGAGMECV
jgi:polar amino acid transport system permease protein